MKKSYIIGFLTVLCVVLSISAGCHNLKSDKKTLSEETNVWYKKHRIVAHAFGMINSTTYTNSLEAFEYNYKKGYRVFEVDLILTSDHFLVASHGWDIKSLQSMGLDLTPGKVPTRNEFLHAKSSKGLTQATIKDVIKLLKKYKDIYIITDTKSYESTEVNETFKIIYDECKGNKKLLSRIIPQFYTYDMLGEIRKVYDFPHFIFTTYNIKRDFVRIADFCVDNGIRVITMPVDSCTKENMDIINNRGLYVFVHTVNEEKVIAEKEHIGDWGIYTDYFDPVRFYQIK